MYIHVSEWQLGETRTDTDVSYKDPLQGKTFLEAVPSASSDFISAALLGNTPFAGYPTSNDLSREGGRKGLAV